ncbi:MAG: hypothetical protein HZA68_15245 [Rhodovulum sp.]|nr:hypothetical protein [Rhodovulum sp.]
MQCEVFVRVPALDSLPAALGQAAKNVAVTCAGVAIAAAGGVSAVTGPAAVVALKPAFVECARSRGGQALAALSIAVDQSCGWSKWSNE